MNLKVIPTVKKQKQNIVPLLQSIIKCSLFDLNTFHLELYCSAVPKHEGIFQNPSFYYSWAAVLCLRTPRNMEVGGEAATVCIEWLAEVNNGLAWGSLHCEGTRGALGPLCAKLYLLNHFSLPLVNHLCMPGLRHIEFITRRGENGGRMTTPPAGPPVDRQCWLSRRTAVGVTQTLTGVSGSQQPVWVSLWRWSIFF